MKLRLRSAATKKTYKLDLPGGATVADLRALLAAHVPDPPSTLRFSLNRSDYINPTSASASLKSLGLTSGDLLFFASSASSSSDSPAVPPPAASEPTSMNLGSEPSPYPYPRRLLVQLMKDENMAQEGLFSRLVLVLHAVLLDCGFVRVCSDCWKENGNPLQLPRDGLSKISPSLMLRYSLSAIAEKSEGAVMLNCSVMGNYAVLYGLYGTSKIVRLCIESSRLASLLCLDGELNSEDNEKETYNLWKELKDGIGFPLLINVCRNNGLQLPPCFSTIPSEVKMRILELIPGVDVVRVGSTCVEMRGLASDGKLWEQKYAKEFGEVRAVHPQSSASWKSKYVQAWVGRQANLTRISRNSLFVPSTLNYPEGYGFFGGRFNHDRSRTMGEPFGPALVPAPPRRAFIPPCDFRSLWP